MRSSLSESAIRSVREAVDHAGRTIAQRYPGDSSRHQPVHTVYGGAHLFRPDTVRKLGDLALRSLEEHAPDPQAFGATLGLPDDERFRETIHERVRAKLQADPVEDFRIDFEDGYGHRPDADEDAVAVAAAAAVARGMSDDTLSPFIGIRVKSFTPALHRRAIRTLDLFVTALLEATGGTLPRNFVVTIPKVMLPAEVAAAAEALAAVEQATGLAPGSLPMEIMVETTQAIIGPDGRCGLPAMVEASNSRCIAAHFGVYDYTASCTITAQHQAMTHPACDFARHAMQVALGGTGIMLSDGATNIMPIAPHRPPEGGSLTPAQRAENHAAVHRAWKIHFDDVRHSLRHAFYQGWDLNPAQLPTRYAAVFSFFLESLASASDRLKAFVERAAQATVVGGVFDDAATGQGLLNFFLRGLNCGAITAEEARLTGLSLEEFAGRSFVRIIENRTRG